MAEDSDLERTEPASPRRLEQAREEGQVARSTELSTLAIVLAGAGALWFFGAGLGRDLKGLTMSALAFDRSAAFDPAAMANLLHAQGMGGLIAFLPFGLLLLVAAVAAPLLIGGWVFSSQVMQPDFERLNPVSGLQRMFS